MKKTNILFVLLFLFTTLTVAQNVGIKADGTAPDNSAMLEVGSTEKGFLMPRMTTAEIAAIASPANGLMVYCTTDGKFYVYNSTIVAWKEIKYGSGVIPTNCGVINDARDGKTYNTVIIGSQCWMKENLNVGTRINSSEWQTGNGTFEKYCNGDNVSNCDVYGGLYQWEEMMQYSETPGVQGICPTGWHLPTQAELTTLFVYLGGKDVAGGKMKEAGTTHWSDPNVDASNSSGFTALPGGLRQTNGSTTLLGITCHFWSSSKKDDLFSFSIILGNDMPEITYAFWERWMGMSVRCIKNN